MLYEVITFVLPHAIGHLRSIKALYDDNPESVLLIVGHTDADGDLV